MKAYRLRRVVALVFCTRMGEWVNHTPRRLYPDKLLRYSLNRTLSGPQRRTGPSRKGINSSPLPEFEHGSPNNWSAYHTILFDLHMNVHRDKFLIIKPICTKFSNLFLEWNSTCFGQFLCPSSGVFHCTHSNGICHSVLLTAASRIRTELQFRPDPACEQTCIPYTTAPAHQTLTYT